MCPTGYRTRHSSSCVYSVEKACVALLWHKLIYVYLCRVTWHFLTNRFTSEDLKLASVNLWSLRSTDRELVYRILFLKLYTRVACEICFFIEPNYCSNFFLCWLCFCVEKYVCIYIVYKSLREFYQSFICYIILIRSPSLCESQDFVLTRNGLTISVL